VRKAIFATAILAMLSGCSHSLGSGSTTSPKRDPTTTPSVPARAALPRVTDVGDSITEMSKSALREIVGPSYRLTIYSRNGTTIHYWLPIIRLRTSKTPQHDWIVELGTNDAGQSNRHWARDFRNEVAMLSEQPCVILVTVNPRHDWPIAGAIDTAISNVVAAEPQFHVLDWGSYEWSSPGWLMSDGVHPTPAGRAALASLEAAALADDCPAS
jgi:lysophospholipase L1-like esterase